MEGKSQPLGLLDCGWHVGPTQEGCKFLAKARSQNGTCAGLQQAFSISVSLLQNWLGLLIMTLVVVYHYITADPKYEA
jgi:hypothetical protein